LKTPTCNSSIKPLYQNRLKISHNFDAGLGLKLGLNPRFFTYA